MVNLDLSDDLVPKKDIRALVENFYGRVRAHETLGPTFNRRVNDWPTHIERLVGFWITVLRGEPAYFPGPKGRPPEVHRAIAELTLGDFDAWLNLFEEVANETLRPNHASTTIARSKRMGRALSAHLRSEESK